ncbi:PQQ-dependent sugar dehydrogenase, partial [Sulfitobacter sp. UBA1132]
RDGTVPADNPFVGRDDVLPEIWSYGHRNPQGAALDLEGNLWVSEHGARGGDEVNAVRKGANYGWPVISYGRHYSGAKIGEGTAKDG